MLDGSSFGELIIVPDCTLDNDSLLKVVISTAFVLLSRFLSSIRGQRLDLINFYFFFTCLPGHYFEGENP